MPDTLPGFHFWIRADASGDRPYALRFETDGAFGMLRVSVHGMLIDGPASKRGYEEHLTAEQVRSSRFMVVWNQRRDRQTLGLGRLDDDHLTSLDLTYWYELVAVREGDDYYLAFESPEPVIQLGETLSENDSTGGTIAALEAQEAGESGQLQLEQAWQDDNDYTDPGSVGPAIAGAGVDLHEPPRRDEAPVEWPAPAVPGEVRHLRRLLDQERARNNALEERVRTLEDELANLKHGGQPARPPDDDPGDTGETDDG